MRRTRFLFSLLLLPLKALALYNGNPSFPMMPETGLFISKDQWFGLKVGYEFDWVYDRRLRMEGQRLEHCSKKVQTYESFSNFGVITLNFNDRVEIFGTLGAMSNEISQRPFSETKISYHTDAQFTWGVGGRAILAYWGDLQVSVNAAYVKSDPSLSSLKVNGNRYSTRPTEIDFSQWQIGIGASYRINWFIPYIGVDHSDFRMRIEHLDVIKFLIPSKHVTFKDSYPIGVFLGFGLSPHRAFNFNIEARFINENAVSLSADFKF
jgi:hypothetical protein